MTGQNEAIRESHNLCVPTWMKVLRLHLVPDKTRVLVNSVISLLFFHIAYNQRVSVLAQEQIQNKADTKGTRMRGKVLGLPVPHLYHT